MSNPYETMSDEELLRKIAADDDDAMEFLIRKYYPLIRKLVQKYYLTGGETDDLYQEGYIGLFKAIRKFDEEKNPVFFAFARLCIESEIQTAVTASNRKKHIPLNTSVPFELQDETQSYQTLKDNPESLVLHREWAKDAQELIREKLSTFEQNVVLLYLQGKSYSEIARELDKTPKSIDNAISRVKNKLKNYVN